MNGDAITLFEGRGIPKGGCVNMDFVVVAGELTGIVVADVAGTGLVGGEGGGDMGDAQGSPPDDR